MTVTAFNGAKAAFITTSPATGNFGSNASLITGFVTLDSEKLRFIIEFDISSIPATSVISAASLALYVNLAPASSFSIDVQRLRRADWVEAEVTANIYKTSNNWTTQLADDGTDDRDNTLLWSYASGTTTGAKTFTDTNLTALAQDAVDTRSGILIMLWKKQTESTALQIRYDSDDGVTADRRPVITLTYTTPAVVVPQAVAGIALLTNVVVGAAALIVPQAVAGIAALTNVTVDAAEVLAGGGRHDRRARV